MLSSSSRQVWLGNSRRRIVSPSQHNNHSRELKARCNQTHTVSNRSNSTNYNVNRVVVGSGKSIVRRGGGLLAVSLGITAGVYNLKDSNNNIAVCEASKPVEKKVVKVELEEELVECLPVMKLCEVWEECSSDKYLVTYDGIVYDVTSFVTSHPGGAELLATAQGLDLSHFFDNYTIHAESEKAANWLAPLAVGKLSPKDAIRAKELSTPERHVSQRMKMLRKARGRILVVAASIPFWLVIRRAVQIVGYCMPTLGVFIARCLPISIPGLTPGSEPLQPSTANSEAAEGDLSTKSTVAVIGGGVAGCGAAWTLTQSGFAVTLYEARAEISGNARTFDWDFSQFRDKGAEPFVKSCVSVTAWPSLFYKNYTALLETLDIPTVHQPLSWFLNSKVPGAEGTLWAADPTPYEGSLRNVFSRDFYLYRKVVDFSNAVTNLYTFRWARTNDSPSMYDSHTGLGLLNPLNVVPLYSIFRMVGGTKLWWDIVFTPHYTSSFLVDELRPFPAVFGPLIEAQIPLNPNSTNAWKGPSSRSPDDCNLTTCVTWKDAGKGIRKVFALLVENVQVNVNTRVNNIQILPNGQKRVYDEHDQYIDVDRVIFACPSNAVGNIHKSHGVLEDIILSTPVYADDHHPSTGHMHAVMHSDANILPSEYRSELLKRASNIVEITQHSKTNQINIENQYNFGVQTPGLGVYDLPLDKKPVMLISHSLGENKSIHPSLVHGTANHARAHPLYSGWNVAAMLSLRLVQGKDGIYYCSNWTTPGNCHDMSLLSGIVCACAIGAKYPFEGYKEAKKDFYRLRDLMGI